MFRDISDLYTEEEIDRMFDENPLMSAEFEPDFLGFSYLYAVASEAVPRYAHIVDVGCCLGLQSRFFEDFAWYTGVDLPDPCYIDGYPPNKKAWFVLDDIPGEYIAAEGADYLHGLASSTTEEEREDMLIIISAVPDEAVYDAAIELFPNTLTWYPGRQAEARGIWREELEDALGRYPH